MPYTQPTLNGTSVSPSSINRTITRYGAEREAANGTPLITIRGTKRQWTLSFDDVAYSVVQTLATIAALTTSYTFVDEQGSSYTVFSTLDALDYDVNPYGTTLLYNATLKIREA